jgi:hypothetical protein
MTPRSLREHNPMALYSLKAAYSIREHNPMAPVLYSLTGTQPSVPTDLPEFIKNTVQFIYPTIYIKFAFY